MKTKFFAAFTILVTAILWIGCDAGGLRTSGTPAAAGTVYFNLSINTALFSTGRGQTLSFQTGKANGQIFLQSGKATIKGTLRNVSGAGAVPGQFEITLTHKSAGGKVLNTFTANLNVNSDGTIPLQSTAFPGFVLQPKENLVFAAKPLDADLPFSQLKVRFKLIAT
jgi:hypothetical protein